MENRFCTAKINYKSKKLGGLFPNLAKPQNVVRHCRTTVTEQNFVTCETNYISKNEWTN